MFIGIVSGLAPFDTSVIAPTPGMFNNTSNEYAAPFESLLHAFESESRLPTIFDLDLVFKR